MIPTAKLAVAMVILTFCSFPLVFLALHIKSKFLFLVGFAGCATGILIGVIAIFITIVFYLKSPPK
jgi:hypothetical protein